MMLRQTFIPVDKKVSPSGKKLDVPPADSTPTGGAETTAKDPPVGWSTIASAVSKIFETSWQVSHMWL